MIATPQLNHDGVVLSHAQLRGASQFTHLSFRDAKASRNPLLASTSERPNTNFDPVIPDTSTLCLACQHKFMPKAVAHDFDTLTRQHKDVVYRQMIRTCGNREDAEDVLIEALLKAYRHLDQLRDSAAFRAWLTQIAKRVCWQLKQREALQPLLQLSELEDEGREIPGAGATPELDLARRQMKQLLDDAIASLPAEYQSVYRLRDIDDRPGDEVAKKLGISRAAMKSRLHRARAMVRDHLDAALTSGNVL